MNNRFFFIAQYLALTLICATAFGADETTRKLPEPNDYFINQVQTRPATEEEIRHFEQFKEPKKSEEELKAERRDEFNNCLIRGLSGTTSDYAAKRIESACAEKYLVEEERAQ